MSDIDVERLARALLNVKHLPTGPAEWHMPFGQAAQSFRNAGLLAGEIVAEYDRLNPPEKVGVGEVPE